MNRVYILMPQMWLPKRSIQHRIAVFALMRCLYRQAQKVEIPKSLHMPKTYDEFVERGKQTPDNQLARAENNRNPMFKLIKRQFRRNKHDTSPRLIYAALSSGYKFVSLLYNAQTIGSPEHKSVIKYLEEHSLKPPKPPKEPISSMPLLKVIPPQYPGGLPSYESVARPLPKEQLSGKRGIPRLCATSNGFPFLRLGNKQPEVLSRVLRYKIAQYEDRAQFKETADEVMDDAIEEDMWDDIVCKLARKEGIKIYRDNGSYVRTLDDGQDWVIKEVDWERRDNINRAEALMKIMLEEEKLAKNEALERDPRLPEKLLGL